MENKLYFGDNLDILRRHVPDESVDLIYIDPPFNSNRSYFVLFKDRTGKASAAQEAAFDDTWTWTQDSEAAFKELITACPIRDLATTIQALRQFLKESPMMAYLAAMALRLVEIHRVLKRTGSFYLHCDPVASHYLKIILDIIFGPENFRNEIVWKRTSSHSNATKRFGDQNDTLLYYSKSDTLTFNRLFTPHSSEYIKSHYGMADENGRRFTTRDLRNPGVRPNLMFEYKGYKPHPNGWSVSRERMEELDAQGLLYFPQSISGRIRLKIYLDESRGTPVGNIWDDISPINSQAAERLGYPTQKPLALLERVINTSSNPGDIVLDCYCGCGTTVTAAHKLMRKWIGIDITAVAVAVIKSRLENSFDDLKGKVSIDGFPADLQGARHLFELDPHRFQVWACTLIDAFPLTKKGADRGVDGWLNFLDLDESPQRAVVQVKGGKVQVAHIRDFCHVVKRENATPGFFICLDNVTAPMQTEAVSEGYWTDAGRHDYPKIQILTVAGLLANTDRARFPSQHGRSMLGYMARQQDQSGAQQELFSDTQRE
ncbi:MAG: DNA methyltransferase [Capsulimonadaceae bacterium]